jgi:catechol 2,3-dioxygenase-like lactoylglutathione lyase family enzyme
MKPRLNIITLGVADMGVSIRFYRDGLGFPTTASDTENWAIFRTSGSRLALFPKAELAKDISPDVAIASAGFAGITLAHNTATRDEVDVVMEQARQAGATIVKTAREAFWGGYSGYFLDPDGYAWEVAWGEGFTIDEHGMLWGGALGDRPVAAKAPDRS